jgi:hypothetical protein
MEIRIIAVKRPSSPTVLVVVVVVKIIMIVMAFVIRLLARFPVLEPVCGLWTGDRGHTPAM